MQIKVTKTFNVRYSVQYFEGTEGGMHNDSYGEYVKTIEQALSLFEIAKTCQPEHDWIIVVDVDVQVD